MSTPKNPIIGKSVMSSFIDKTIQPGDRVWTFTQNGRGSRVAQGVYLGVTEKKGSWRSDPERIETKYAIQREDKITYMSYRSLVPLDTKLEELDGYTLS